MDSANPEKPPEMRLKQEPKCSAGDYLPAQGRRQRISMALRRSRKVLAEPASDSANSL